MQENCFPLTHWFLLLPTLYSDVFFNNTGNVKIRYWICSLHVHSLPLLYLSLCASSHPLNLLSLPSYSSPPPVWFLHSFSCDCLQGGFLILLLFSASLHSFYLCQLLFLSESPFLIFHFVIQNLLYEIPFIKLKKLRTQNKCILNISSVSCNQLISQGKVSSAYRGQSFHVHIMQSILNFLYVHTLEQRDFLPGQCLLADRAYIFSFISFTGCLHSARIPFLNLRLEVNWCAQPLATFLVSGWHLSRAALHY